MSKGSVRRRALVTVAEEYAAWSRLYVSCQRCGNRRVLRGSERCWKCAAKIATRKGKA